MSRTGASSFDPRMNHAAGELFRRSPGNPIITTDDLPYRANSVFNPGATIAAGTTLLLLRHGDAARRIQVPLQDVY